ncbi:MAG: hypothetical protein FWB86_11445 [Treponema sp.]|nr:hypothetical protein [Treponema sp.]MCL2252528.1 hypothetical protein [Treponema sp.]
MADRTCKYCGAKVNALNGSCIKSPTKSHVTTSDGKHCIWCGTPGSRTSTFLSTTCSKSPTKTHQIDA